MSEDDDELLRRTEAPDWFRHYIPPPTELLPSGGPVTALYDNRASRPLDVFVELTNFAGTAIAELRQFCQGAEDSDQPGGMMDKWDEPWMSRHVNLIAELPQGDSAIGGGRITPHNPQPGESSECRPLIAEWCDVKLRFVANAPRGYMSRHVIHPNFQGLGLGKITTLTRMWYARQQGYYGVFCVVKEKNKPARKLLKRLGFTRRHHSWDCRDRGTAEPVKVNLHTYDMLAEPCEIGRPLHKAMAKLRIDHNIRIILPEEMRRVYVGGWCNAV